MSPDKIRLGLIGCGEHSLESIVPSLCTIDEATLVAVCDDSKEKAVKVARRFPACEEFCDFNSLIQSGSIDAVIVAAPPQVHFEAAREAIRKGVHVFVEKPPTQTKAELATLVEEAERQNIVTGVGHNLRHATAAVEMQRMLVDPPFGKPMAMEMRYFASKPRGDRWGLGSPLRSFLLSHANHAIDFMIYQMGSIARVNAAVASGQGSGIALTAQFVFESGAVGSLLATSAAPHFSISGTIVSDRSRIVQIHSLDELVCFGIGDDAKRWGRCWTSKTLQTGFEAAGYSTELREFIGAIQERNPARFRPSFRDELDIYDAIDAIQQKIENHS